MLGSLTTSEKINLVLAGAAILAVVVATLQLRLSNAAVRRSSQPVVIAHEEGSDFGGPGAGFLRYDVYLENHGAGPAFNVRFGLELGGTRYPFRLGDAQRGARQLVPANGRVPVTGRFHISIPWAPFAVSGGRANATRALWARYENAFGETYETRNPTDPEADFTICRRRGRLAIRLREHRESLRRKKIERVANTRLQADLVTLQERAPVEDGDGEGDG